MMRRPETDLLTVYPMGLWKSIPSGYNLTGLIVRWYMRKILWLLAVAAGSAVADPDVRPFATEMPEHPSWQLEWDNSTPQQRQALDQFYQSLQQLQGGEQMVRRMEREEHLEKLRDMTPEQRQQQFRDFVHTPGMQPNLPPPPPPPPGIAPPVR